MTIRGQGFGDSDVDALHTAAMLYSGAVDAMAVGLDPLGPRVAHAYGKLAAPANRIVAVLPCVIADDIGDLQMMLGQGRSAAGDLDTEALEEALTGMDDATLEQVARKICFINLRLGLATRELGDSPSAARRQDTGDAANVSTLPDKWDLGH